MCCNTQPTSRENGFFIRSRSRFRAQLFRKPLLKPFRFDGIVPEKHQTRQDAIGNGYELERSLSVVSPRGVCGTSLVELLVVLALLSMMVLVAADLVVHSMELLGATGRTVRNPLVVHVTSRLRHDVQEAAALQREEWVWSEDPLVLVNQDGTLVSIGLEDGNLVREKADGSGGPPDRRVILRGVTSWWWRTPVADVVDLNITYLVNPAPERQVSRDVGYGLERRQENLRFAIRGGGGGTRW
jgi:hypothetical protein